jgi:cell shape-determining protein MreD
MVLASSIAVRHAQPDFLLIAALIGSLYCNIPGATWLGFATGLIHASIASPPSGFGSLIVSRTIVCFLVGWLEERLFRDSLPVALTVVAAGSVLAESLFFIGAPQRHVMPWLHAMVFGGCYNVALTLVAYPLIRLAVIGRERRRVM